MTATTTHTYRVMTSLRWWGAALAVWLTLGAAGVAQAQTSVAVEADAPPDKVEVEVPVPHVVEEDDALVRVQLGAVSPHRMFELRSPQNELLATCRDACSIDLPRGTYIVEIPSSAGDAAGRAKLTVTEAGAWEVADADREGARTGLVMGIAGTVLIPVSLVAMLAGVGCGPDGCSDGDGKRQLLVGGGLVGLVLGLVLTPVGWSKFARDRRAEVRSADPRVSWGMLPGGAQFGLTASF